MKLTILTIIILLLIVLYLIIGRIVMNIFYDKNLVDIDPIDEESIKGIGSVFFPLVLIWVGIRELADFIFKKIY